MPPAPRRARILKRPTVVPVKSCGAAGGVRTASFMSDMERLSHLVAFSFGRPIVLITSGRNNEGRVAQKWGVVTLDSERTRLAFFGPALTQLWRQTSCYDFGATVFRIVGFVRVTPLPAVNFGRHFLC